MSEQNKQCPRCKALLQTSSFYHCASHSDGLQTYCKSCTKQLNDAHRRAHPEKYRGYMRKYALRTYWADPTAAIAKTKAWNDAHPNDRAIHSTLSRKREVYRAGNTVSCAIEKGALVRQPCEKCGATPADAHHDDYSRRLNVRWLCRRCHQAYHRMLRDTAPNAAEERDAWAIEDRAMPEMAYHVEAAEYGRRMTEADPSIAVDAAEFVWHYLVQVPLKEALVLIWRFGLAGETPMNLEEIATLFHVTRERIRQLEAQALVLVAALARAGQRGESSPSVSSGYPQ